MGEQIYRVKDLKKQIRKRKVKDWIQDRIYDARDFVSNNMETILVLGPAALGAVTTVVKVVSKHVQRGKEKDLKDLYCYDRSLGHYWRLRRELTNTEWLEIDRRKNNGERLSDILSELKVLK